MGDGSAEEAIGSLDRPRLPRRPREWEAIPRPSGDASSDDQRTWIASAPMPSRPWGARAVPLALGREGRDSRPGRPAEQPQELRRRNPPAAPNGGHRAVRVRQVLAGIRHRVRGRPAPVCGIAVGIRATVPGADGEAGRRRRGWGLPRGRDRAEEPDPDVTLHGRHVHRGLRLSAPSLGANRPHLLPTLRAGAEAGHGPVGDGHAAGTAGGDSVRGRLSAQAVGQGDGRDGAREPAGAGLPAGGRQRRAEDAGRGRGGKSFVHARVVAARCGGSAVGRPRIGGPDRRSGEHCFPGGGWGMRRTTGWRPEARYHRPEARGQRPETRARGQRSEARGWRRELPSPVTRHPSRLHRALRMP